MQSNASSNFIFQSLPTQIKTHIAMPPPSNNQTFPKRRRVQISYQSSVTTHAYPSSALLILPPISLVQNIAPGNHEDLSLPAYSGSLSFPRYHMENKISYRNSYPCSQDFPIHHTHLL